MWQKMWQFFCGQTVTVHTPLFQAIQHIFMQSALNFMKQTIEQQGILRNETQNALQNSHQSGR